jgi:hypothetical protein
VDFLTVEKTRVKYTINWNVVSIPRINDLELMIGRFIEKVSSHLLQIKIISNDIPKNKNIFFSF